MAKNIFSSTRIQITNQGERHLGASIGSPEFKMLYVRAKIDDWISQLKVLSKIAENDPHSAFSAFTFGFKHKWSYLMRTVPGISDQFEPLEHVIRENFIPALIGSTCSDELRNLLALPPRLGGLGIINPAKLSDAEFRNSSCLTEKLAKLINDQEHALSIDPDEQKTLIKVISQRREEFQKNDLETLRQQMSPRDLKINEMAKEVGASNWLTALPLKDFHFNLNKQEFRDSLRLRYGLPIMGLPQFCACGSTYSIDHAMVCKKGGFVSIRHDEVRDITAGLLKEVCTDVETEPHLIPLDGEVFNNRTANRSDEARLDISARGFWIRGQRAFFDTRVFYPLAPSYLSQSLSSTHRAHENEKRRQYNHRILQVEMGSFSPLVFSTSAGMAPECSLFYSRLADKISEKRHQPKSVITAWLRCRIGFSLLRSALLCLRGSRTVRPNCDVMQTDFDVAVVRGRLSSG